MRVFGELIALGERVVEVGRIWAVGKHWSKLWDKPALNERKKEWSVNLNYLMSISSLPI